MLRNEIDRTREEYQETLEAIQHQQLVIQKLESLLWKKLPTQAMMTDSAAQTDTSAFASSQSVFYQLAKVKMQIHRAKTRNRVASVAREEYVKKMDHDIEELRDIVKDKLPPGYQVDAILEASKAKSKQTVQEVLVAIVPEELPKRTFQVGTFGAGGGGATGAGTPSLQQQQQNQDNRVTSAQDELAGIQKLRDTMNTTAGRGGGASPGAPRRSGSAESGASRASHGTVTYL